MDYIIAGIQLGIDPQLFRRGSFGQALAPFIALRETPTDLIVEAAAEVGQTGGWHELNRFMFSDVDTQCLFGRDDAGYLLTMTPGDGSPSANFRMDFGGNLVRCDVTERHDPALFRFGLWQMFNILSVQRQVVAIHSSVIWYQGEAVLFLGESGTGKSTHTRLWMKHILGSELLNDDSPFVGVAGREVTAFGSPWSGKAPCYRNEHCSIRAFVRLSQAPHNRIRRLRPIEAIGALLPSCPPSFAYDERLQDAVCQTVSAIVADTPVYHLECLPDAAAAELVCSTLFGQ